jgi:hypothetical protein
VASKKKVEPKPIIKSAFPLASKVILDGWRIASIVCTYTNNQ